MADAPRPGSGARRRGPHVRSIAFDTRKHGRYLLADAGAADSLPGFIRSCAPHQLTFFEVALIEDARGHVTLDGEPLAVGPRRVIVTAAGETRSWFLAGQHLRASLAFFEASMVDGLAASASTTRIFPFMTAARAARAFTAEPRDFERLVDLVGAMREELRAPRPDSAELLRAQLHHLLALLQRHCGDAPGERDAARAIAQRYVELVEARFAEVPTVAEYARAMRVSPRHLNACVRRATGRTASAVIHDRLVLEAQRRLLRCDAAVSRIADELGFSDASYFVRFFRQRTGCSPAAFRREHGSPILHREAD